MIRRRHTKNLSNYFAQVSNVGKELDMLLDKTSEYISGVEITGKKGVTDFLLVTPPHLRLKNDSGENLRENITKEFSTYEGYLLKPFFLPLYESLNGELLGDIEALVEQLDLDEVLWMQWLFRRAYDWKENALHMYESYLRGNEDPSTIRFGRAIQDRTLHLLNKISSFNITKEYVDAVENKIMDGGFQFQLRLAIYSETPIQIKEQVEDVFRKYDAHNALRLYKVKDKKLQHYIKECIMTADTKYQILSKREILSLFGNNTRKSLVAPYTEVTGFSGNFNELPDFPVVQGEVREGIVQDIAEALKRVGIIQQARLYNGSITSGVRLTVIQFNIPKGKTLTSIISKAKDIQAVLGVPSLGVEQGDEPDTVKFVIPNENPAIVSLKSLLELKSFQKFAKENPLAFIVGVDEINNPIFLSLAKLVHLLIAGATGSGKSVFLNSLAVTLMLTHSPQQLKMFMIDPKQVEMQQYVDFPHVEDVVTDMDRAVEVLAQLTTEMDNRYTIFKEKGVKNIQLYNEVAPEKMPYIVCIIDEYADLKDINPDVEDYIVRLGQKARAAGIHLVIATQRPDVKIISGRLKANLPNAISFNLSNSNHYKTVFGSGIPFTLLGRGDGVMRIEGYPKEFQRFQSAIISPDESQEAEVYRRLADELRACITRDKSKNEEQDMKDQKPLEKPLNEFEDQLYKLKEIIANTRETKVTYLRDALGVKTTTLTELMNRLVDEGWLIKHSSKTKGYELIVSEDILNKWKSE